MNNLLDLLNKSKNNFTIQDAFVKANSIINNNQYHNIYISLSGGSDSDLILDICHRITNKKLNYFFFDTGIEYQATKKHLDYLENRYNIKIERIKSEKSVAKAVKEKGQPFLNKLVSENIGRLQKHNFKFEDKSFSELKKLYPAIESSLKWWCNEKGEKSRFNIERNKKLKEFLLLHPPKFKISQNCCNWAKKYPSKKLIKERNIDLMITGIRQSEGGVRSIIYKSCFDSATSDCSKYRPIFWFSDEDKKEYKDLFDIKHSDCYSVYGLERTGCSCCPFSRNLIEELNITNNYEASLYNKINVIFKDSIEYTKLYLSFLGEPQSQKPPRRAEKKPAGSKE